MNKNVNNPLKKVNYKSVDKFDWKSLKEGLPKQIIPTKRINHLFGGIMILIIIINLASFPWASLMDPTSFEEGIAIKLGWPKDFFVMNLADPSEIPVKFGGTIVDLIVGYLIAYLLEIVINLILLSDPIQKVSGKREFIEAKPQSINVKQL